jgi:hypothetical protein
MGPLTGQVWRLLALALTLASSVRADLVVIEPADVPGSFEIVPMFGLWGQQNTTLHGAELLVYGEPELEQYCGAVAEYERTGVANLTLRARAAGNKVVLLNRYTGNGTVIDWYCPGDFGYERFVFLPCLLLGDNLLQMYDTFTFGALVYDRPGPFRQTVLPPNRPLSIPSFDDMSAAIFGRGEVNRCTKATVIFQKGVTVNQGLSRVLEPRNETVLVNLSVTPSAYQRAWALPLVQVWFAGVLPVGYLSVALLAVHFFRKRYALLLGAQAGGKTDVTKRLFMIWVLALNACTSLLLAVLLAIDGTWPCCTPARAPAADPDTPRSSSLARLRLDRQVPIGTSQLHPPGFLRYFLRLRHLDRGPLGHDRSCGQPGSGEADHIGVSERLGDPRSRLPRRGRHRQRLRWRPLARRGLRGLPGDTCRL